MTVNDSSPLPITRGFVFLLFEPTISSSEFFYQTFLFLTIILLTDYHTGVHNVLNQISITIGCF